MFVMASLKKLVSLWCTYLDVLTKLNNKSLSCILAIDGTLGWGKAGDKGDKLSFVAFNFQSKLTQVFWATSELFCLCSVYSGVY